MPLNLSNPEFLTILGAAPPEPTVQVPPSGVPLIPKELKQPFLIDFNTGGIAYTQSVATKASMHLIDLIFTRKGERVMQPNYGVGAQDFLFEPNDGVHLLELQTLIADQVSLWNPEIVIKSVVPQKTDPMQGILSITVNFTISNVPGLHTITYDVNGLVIEV